MSALSRRAKTPGLNARERLAICRVLQRTLCSAVRKTLIILGPRFTILRFHLTNPPSGCSIVRSSTALDPRTFGSRSREIVNCGRCRCNANPRKTIAMHLCIIEADEYFPVDNTRVIRIATLRRLLKSGVETKRKY